jgi:hypothetical protein
MPGVNQPDWHILLELSKFYKTWLFENFPEASPLFSEIKYKIEV